MIVIYQIPILSKDFNFIIFGSNYHPHEKF